MDEEGAFCGMVLDIGIVLESNARLRNIKAFAAHDQ